MLVRTLFVLLLCILPFAAPAALPPKNVEFKGYVTVVTEKEITVKGPIGPRVFQIYPGTVFGKGASQKLKDFKPGKYVTIVFSEAAGLVKAENIRTSAPPKPKPPLVPPPKKKK